MELRAGGSDLRLATGCCVEGCDSNGRFVVIGMMSDDESLSLLVLGGELLPLLPPPAIAANPIPLMAPIPPPAML